MIAIEEAGVSPVGKNVVILGAVEQQELFQ